MMNKTLSTSLITGAIALLATACTSTGEIDNPMERRFTWFSFISGEDIQASCTETGQEGYRLIYQADRAIQVRIYDIDPTVTPVPQQRSRIMTVAANDWFPWPILTDPTRPFRPYDSVSPLTPAQVDAVREDLLKSGWSTRPAPVGKRIASTSYTWLVSGCRNGIFSFQAYEYPDPAFQNLKFPDILFGADASGYKVVPAPTDGKRRELSILETTGRKGQEEAQNLYNMLVTETGVRLVD